MATSILLKFLTLKWNISRTICCIEVGDGSLFCIFHILSFELNFFFDRRFLLILRALFVLYAKKTQKRYITTLLSIPLFGDNYSSFWSNLKTKINQTDGITMSDFITNLDPYKKVLLLLGGLSIPIDDVSVVLIKRSVASAVGKIHKLRTAKLREIEAPWLTK